MAITNSNMKKWLWGDATSQIITVNLCVWVVLVVLMLTHKQEQSLILGYFGVPSVIDKLPGRCWTLLTYMFSHYDFTHLVVNMLWMLLFGRLLAYQIGDRGVWETYIMCGLGGALLFVLATLAHAAYPKCMLGASCAVIGLVGMALVLIPKVRVDLLMLGQIRVVWISIIAIVLFVVIEPDLIIQLAHLGGLATGVVYGLLKVHVRSIHARTHPFKERELDNLLSKVGRSGYSSLSSQERQRLFEMSQNLKKKK